MDNDCKFWLSLWSVIGTKIVLIALIIALWNHYNNMRYTEMWNNCINAGGQPITEPMVGSTSTTFTCKIISE